MSLMREIAERIFFPNRDPHAIPVLDGGFSPNGRLDEATTFAELDAPDALTTDPEGAIYVSSGNRIYRYSTGTPGSPTQFAECEAPVGALSFGNGLIYAALAGVGVVALDRDGAEQARLTEADGAPLGCVTALATDAGGEVFLTDGSQTVGPQDWLRDLMQKHRGSGRVIACDSGLCQPRVLHRGLRWPAGVVADGDRLLVTEAWAHRLLCIARDGSGMQVLQKNFTGYPSRIRAASEGGFWIAFFALRTQLTEFVLREDAFRTRMMMEIAPELWIGPSMGDHFDYREPTQVGRIKKLGIQKPWAPPRSYGLIARVTAEGEAIESLHSRVSGMTHGITDMVERDRRLIVLSKGGRKLVWLPMTPENTETGRIPA
ncbi:SMP-30/gluconolactonase/LRE family protein [Salipiger abyssi]|uniref:SMP-30/gluconolactonase/LRE family protein n=1 Tax=Salipiger abyssi TaxID=1250539 RepID=UPI001A8D2322|nr:hypothetical protein [Salipiger abyssi]MBN9887148.1 hypothetical protein [Salipiger abyssi]